MVGIANFLHFEQAGSTLRLRFNLTVNENLFQLWPNFLKVEKLSALRFLLHGHLLDRLEVLGGKVVEVVLQLPNLCLPHLDQRVLGKQSDQNIFKMSHYGPVSAP